MGDHGGEDMTTLFEILYKNAEPYKIKLIRGVKGSYGWEITCVADYRVGALNMIQQTDTELRKLFGGGEKP